MRGWMLACDVVIWVESLRRRHGHWLLWIWQFLTVWTVGGLTGSQSWASRALLTLLFHILDTFLTSRACSRRATGGARAPLCFADGRQRGDHPQSALSYFLSLSLELGSCRASEKGGDFLLDKHVINLREHILSHRKITAGEMSEVVTQTALQIVVILNTCTIQQIDLFPLWTIPIPVSGLMQSVLRRY